MTRTAPIWLYGEVNPATPEFKVLDDGTDVSFMPLEAVWPGDKANYTNTLPWSSKRNYSQFRRGDILVPKITPTFEAGRTTIAKVPLPLGLASTEVHVVRPRASTDPRFLQYCFRSLPFIDEGAHSLQGVGNLRRVTSRFVQGHKVLHANPDTQRYIADYLDHETDEIDEIIAKLDELMEVLTARRHAIIASVLASMSARIRLTLVVDIISGSGFPDRFQGVSGQELPFYKVSSLSLADEGYLREADNSVSRNVAAEVGARIIPPGSVIMAKIGAALLLARYAVTSRPACIDNNLQALVPRSKLIDSRFLAYAMEEVSISSLVKPGPVPSLDVMGMKMTDIAYDNSLEEQHRIVDHLDEVTSKINTMIAKVSELKSLLIERRAALITDVVTGRKKVA